MAQNRNKKIVLLVVILIALLGFSTVLLRAFYYFPSDEVVIPDAVVTKPATTVSSTDSGIEIPPNKPGEAPVSAPDSSSAHLSIPAIHVSTSVVDLGITAKGNMAAPRKFSEAGWYKYGTYPGELGSAVIAGHVDNGLSLPAVFADLKDLVAGDDIFLTTKEGKELHFVVTGSKVYDYNSAPTEVFNDKSDKILNLITCSGTFMTALRTHDKRLVVRAVLSE